jgi:hypothetical protein
MSKRQLGVKWALLTSGNATYTTDGYEFSDHAENVRRGFWIQATNKDGQTVLLNPANIQFLIDLGEAE